MYSRNRLRWAYRPWYAKWYGWILIEVGCLIKRPICCIAYWPLYSTPSQPLLSYKRNPPPPPPKICLAARAAIPATATFAPVLPRGPPGPIICWRRSGLCCWAKLVTRAASRGDILYGSVFCMPACWGLKPCCMRPPMRPCIKEPRCCGGICS